MQTAKPACLVEAGHICLQEKHGNIIKNQKTALSQLRQRVGELELAKPLVGSHQATLKELSRVRHELAKLKSEGLYSRITRTSKKQPEEEEKCVQVYQKCNIQHYYNFSSVSALYISIISSSFLRL